MNHLRTYLWQRALLSAFAVLLTTFSSLKAQDDNTAFTIIYLNSGDVFVGQIVERTDSSYVINEQNLGQVIVAAKDVDKVKPVTSTSYLRLTLLDNSVYSGQLIDVTEQFYILRMDGVGEVNIERGKVIDLTIVNRRLMVSNPNCTRYFFAPSAIPLQKREGYYQNAYLLANSVNFGITPNLSLGGGVVIPLLFYVTPKVGFKITPNLHLGAGVLAATTLIPGTTMSGGIPFGLATIGNQENNFTLGTGYGLLWSDGEFETTKYPIVTANGMTRVSKRIHLVSENWIIPYQNKNYVEVQDEFGNWTELQTVTTNDVYMALSLGMRIMVGERSTVDFAPVYLYGDSDQGIVIPYLDFVYKF